MNGADYYTVVGRQESDCVVVVMWLLIVSEFGNLFLMQRVKIKAFLTTPLLLLEEEFHHMYSTMY